MERGHDLNRRLDELTGVPPDDPRVEALAADLADHIPAEMAAAMVGSLESPVEGPDAAEGARWLDTLLGELPPAQVATFRRLVAILKQRR